MSIYYFYKINPPAYVMITFLSIRKGHPLPNIYVSQVDTEFDPSQVEEV